MLHTVPRTRCVVTTIGRLVEDMETKHSNVPPVEQLFNERIIATVRVRSVPQWVGNEGDEDAVLMDFQEEYCIVGPEYSERKHAFANAEDAINFLLASNAFEVMAPARMRMWLENIKVAERSSNWNPSRDGHCFAVMESKFKRVNDTQRQSGKDNDGGDDGGYKLVTLSKLWRNIIDEVTIWVVSGLGTNQDKNRIENGVLFHSYIAAFNWCVQQGCMPLTTHLEAFWKSVLQDKNKHLGRAQNSFEREVLHVLKKEL
jgi:hypothetical protein